MIKNLDELEDILPESSTQLVSLNTRIPRYLNDRIDMSVGIIQTNSKYHKVTKQSAVQILLEKGFEAVLAEFERLDVEEPKKEIPVARVEREEQPQRSFDMEIYAQMANKTYYEPQYKTDSNSISTDSRVTRMQQRLGLR